MRLGIIISLSLFLPLHQATFPRAMELIQLFLS